MEHNSQKCKNCVDRKADTPRGEDSHRWKGGRYKASSGYIRLYLPDYPKLADKNSKQMFEHVWVMEQHLGRYLTEKENVHHKNGIKDDNRIENLELWSRAQPTGQRASDKIDFAIEILSLYAPELLHSGTADIAVGSDYLIHPGGLRSSSISPDRTVEQ